MRRRSLIISARSRFAKRRWGQNIGRLRSHCRISQISIAPREGTRRRSPCTNGPWRFERKFSARSTRMSRPCWKVTRLCSGRPEDLLRQKTYKSAQGASVRVCRRLLREIEQKQLFFRACSAHYSGCHFRKRAPSGGNVRLSVCGRPKCGIDSARTFPRLPTLEPP